jgi:hypothetical protein
MGVLKDPMHGKELQSLRTIVIVGYRKCSLSTHWFTEPANKVWADFLGTDLSLVAGAKPMPWIADRLVVEVI